MLDSNDHMKERLINQSVEKAAANTIIEDVGQ